MAMARNNRSQRVAARAKKRTLEDEPARDKKPTLEDEFKLFLKLLLLLFLPRHLRDRGSVLELKLPIEMMLMNMSH